MALACAVSSFVLYELWGQILGAILAAAAIYAGKKGSIPKDETWR